MKQAFCMAAALAVLAAGPAWAQQATVGSRFNSANQSFFENVGVQWGLNFRNGFARFGGPPPVQAQGGLQGGLRGRNGFFNFHAAQGSHRSNIMQAPSVTVMNGGRGFVADVTQRPFVIGVVPVVGAGAPIVGGMPMMGVGPFGAPMDAGGFQVERPSPIAQRLARLKEQGVQIGGARNAGDDQPPPAPQNDDQPPPAPRADVPPPPPQPHVPADPLDIKVQHFPGGDPARLESVAELRRHRAEQEKAAESELDLHLQRGREAEAAGKFGAARVYYQMAIRRAEGEQKQELILHLRTLQGR